MKIMRLIKPVLLMSAMAAIFFFPAASVTLAETDAANEKIFYPAAPLPPKLQFLVSFSYDKNVKEERFPLEDTPTAVQIKRPYDIGSTKGRLYLSDQAYKKVVMIDLNTKKTSFIDGEYDSAGIWVTEDDFKYVADFKKKQILVFDSANKLVKVYAHRNQFEKPTDVAVFQNKIYITDMIKHMVVVIDRETGKTIKELGGPGTEDGKFYKPSHVIVDKDGNVYVNDFFNMRIQKFSPEEEFQKSFGSPGDTLGSLARPKGISVDREGHLYVVDAAFENVQVFDDETTDLLLFFGGFELGHGQMYLPSPVYADYNNVEYFSKYADKDFSVKYIVLVGNTLGPFKLNVYGFGDWTGQPTAPVEKSEVMPETQSETKPETQPETKPETKEEKQP